MNTYQKTLFVVLLVGLTKFTQAQNNIYLEAGGNAVLYSINYERIISLNDNLKLAPRVGFEFVPRNYKEYNTYGEWSFPFELNVLLSKTNTSKHHLEGGFGLSLFNLVDQVKYNDMQEIIDTKTKAAKITMFRLGYRYQKPAGGLMFRAGLLARITQDNYSKRLLSDDLFYRLWPGFSVGYNF